MLGAIFYPRTKTDIIQHNILIRCHPSADSPRSSAVQFSVPAELKRTTNTKPQHKAHLPSNIHRPCSQQSLYLPLYQRQTNRIRIQLLPPQQRRTSRRRLCASHFPTVQRVFTRLAIQSKAVWSLQPTKRQKRPRLFCKESVFHLRAGGGHAFYVFHATTKTTRGTIFFCFHKSIDTIRSWWLFYSIRSSGFSFAYTRWCKLLSWERNEELQFCYFTLYIIICIQTLNVNWIWMKYTQSSIFFSFLV